MIYNYYSYLIISSHLYQKKAIFCFSYYEYLMKCPELNTQIIRKDRDFYFLREFLQKIYPAIVVSILHINYYILILLIVNNRYHLYPKKQFLIIFILRKQIGKK